MCETMPAPCGPANTDGCTAVQKEAIEAFKKMDMKVLEQKIQEKEKDIERQKTHMDEFTESLNKKFKEGEKIKEAAFEAQDAELSLLKVVRKDCAQGFCK